MVNSVAVTALLLVLFYITANKEYLTKTNYFRKLNSAFLQLYSLKSSVKLAYISRSYQENLWAPFSIHCSFVAVIRTPFCRNGM